VGANRRGWVWLGSRCFKRCMMIRGLAYWNALVECAKHGSIPCGSRLTVVPVNHLQTSGSSLAYVFSDFPWKLATDLYLRCLAGPQWLLDSSSYPGCYPDLDRHFMKSKNVEHTGNFQGPRSGVDAEAYRLVSKTLVQSYLGVPQ